MLFFDKIRSAILDEDQDGEVDLLRASAFESVRQDPGLHQLVPYFVTFVAEKVTHSLNNLFVLQQMMTLTEAVIANKSLYVDPYATQLAPAILTCLIGRHLGRPGDSPKKQYELRDLAASLLQTISKKYGATSGELQTRLARTCLKTYLDPTRSLGEHYGGLIGFSAVSGLDGIRTVILDTIKTYEVVLKRAINELGDEDTGVKKMRDGAIMKAILSLTDGDTIEVNDVNGNTADDGPALAEYLGEIIGSRVASINNHRLNKIILDSRGKTS
jgi:transcription initiation factor TFIID subunit 6